MVVLRSIKVDERVINIKPGTYLSDNPDPSPKYVVLNKRSSGLILEELKDKTSQDDLTRPRVLVGGKLVIVWVNKDYECV